MDLMKKSVKYRFFLGFCVLVTILCLILLSWLCPDKVCALSNWHYSQFKYPSWSKLSLKHVVADNLGRPLTFLSHPLIRERLKTVDVHDKLSFDELIRSDFHFDIKGSDVIVFLHIQKTGGTSFGRHLVRDLDLEQPCQCRKGRKKCRCYRPDSDDKYWLFSRYSTGWKCGLHADWTELTNCVESAMDQTEKGSAKRRYFYITLLREPVARFLSEFRHVQRGATWKTSRHLCDGRPPTPEELPQCFAGEDWRDVSLNEFMNCHSNLAINRQTRMLADLTLVGCYNTSAMPARDRDMLMLASAKENLRKMAFFGLCEYQKISQYLFESTFHLHFLQPFHQLNETHGSLARTEISEEDIKKIRRLNHLDIQLYEYATNLLKHRFEVLKKTDKNFEMHFKNLGKKKNNLDPGYGSGLKES
ncbi:heparan-sulfate 6-O-sulfotransferase 1-B [Trichonephila inaurata madagascariensis]|uniref:Heparan-sulfate 6-O-sulfotransferase n=1 Tax=Trichonephila inaurata madagascariensis TaxID=2747483 RepID=A0A8X6WXP1_9ARAC|nr:heparan-sulfate 6-O-sulfotransferase 1-B [Trichonephila inaurata madagascariensis]